MSQSQEIKSEYRRRAREKYWSEHERSTYQCPDCGRRERDLLEKMEVHHIDGDPSNNKLDNLVGLCQVCHNLREEKKPSIRKTTHLINQFSGQESYPSNQSVPVCKTHDEYGEYVESCFEKRKPALVVNMAGKRKWASVEVDMLSIEGVFEVANADRKGGLSVVLNQEAASCINAICHRYREYETGDFRRHAILSVPSEPINGYHSFPSMRPDVAESFANDLQTVVDNPAFWQVVPSHLERTIEEHGHAEMKMADLDWLPNRLQRDPWTIEEEDLRIACERCGELFANHGSDEVHCDHCKKELAWQYSDCDHEKTGLVNADGKIPNSVLNPDEELVLQCSECGATKPRQPKTGLVGLYRNY